MAVMLFKRMCLSEKEGYRCTKDDVKKVVEVRTRSEDSWAFWQKSNSGVDYKQLSLAEDVR